MHYRVCYQLDNCTSDLVQKHAVYHCFSSIQLKALAKYWFTLEVLRIMVEVLGNLLVVFASIKVGYVENNCWNARGIGEKAMLIGNFFSTALEKTLRSLLLTCS